MAAPTDDIIQPTKPLTSSPLDQVKPAISGTAGSASTSPDKEPSAPRTTDTRRRGFAGWRWFARSPPAAAGSLSERGARRSLLVSLPHNLAADHRDRGIDGQDLLLRNGQNVAAKAGEVRDLSDLDRAEISFPE